MIKVKTKETDNGTTQTQLARGDEGKTGKVVKALNEVASKPGKRFEVILIEEGMGNFGDCFYYPGEVLMKCAHLFEGKKKYANHPSKTEDYDRPERDVKDISGYFENVKAENVDGRICLMAEAVVPVGASFDWARDLMCEALEYKDQHPEQELIGLSINAGGSADKRDIKELLNDPTVPNKCKEKLKEAQSKGIDFVNYTLEITDVTSVDLVTEAGAGGKINKMLEGKHNMKNGKANTKNREADPSTDKNGGDTAHPDADQDKALVADMLKKHLGDDGKEMDEAAMAAVHETYESYKEMGHEAEEAAKMACAHHKVEKQKQAKHEAADKAKKDADGDNDGDADAKEVGQNPFAKKEAEKIMKLAGRIAFLESVIQKNSLNEYMDKKLKETKLPRNVTDAFRKTVGDVKSEKEFDSKLGLFMEGYKIKAEHEAPSFVFTEKARDLNNVTDDLSFADCKD